MQKLKKLIIKVIEITQSTVRPLFIASPFLSRLYYLLFDRAFGYEQQAILKAKIQYETRQGMQDNSSSLLRRNIHRIEKGLIMRPRKDVFALDYIEETVSVYSRAAKVEHLDHADLVWAYSVLQQFFTVCDLKHPTIKASFEIFQAVKFQSDATSVPYLSSERVAHDISSEQLKALCKSRRSVRWFEQKKVDKSLLIEALTISTEAPSACNRQAFEFMWIDDEETKREAVELPGGTAGFASQIPCLLAVIGDLSAYPFERDRHVIYIDASLASMQFMLACETLGLSTCVLNWPELHTLDKRAAKLLNLPQHKRIIMFIAVGYALADGGIPFSNKKKAATLLTYVETKKRD
ncbi:nitroreductase family protein [Pseudoalteromonas xiamenensis]|uniref:nitroreductase family protein n=1 Tax=Pseudoalteromonas xiamenensis TaxID=882626 RepID=UPI0027E48B20|nr:nitroreductase family protein [Pseudoalteromonas xiamenensis]WMN61219.1 nitroreductase family protein [Pseudoalteromonas xiamenensis]